MLTTESSEVNSKRKRATLHATAQKTELRPLQKKGMATAIQPLQGIAVCDFSSWPVRVDFSRRARFY